MYAVMRQIFSRIMSRRGSSSTGSLSYSLSSSSDGSSRSVVSPEIEEMSEYLTASETSLQSSLVEEYGEEEDRGGDDEEEEEEETQSVSFSDLSVSASDMEFITSLEGGKMILNFVRENSEGEYLSELFQPLFDWIDPHLTVYTVDEEMERSNVIDDDLDERLNVIQMPAMAVVLFLKEDNLVGDEKLSQVKRRFLNPPWRFHHSEDVSRGKINACPYNNQDYYMAGDDSPLCAIRQVHCGKQLLRIVRFVSSANWKDCINFYGLVLGQDPDLVKPDFCLFTTGSCDDYDIQLSLKRVPKGIECKPVETTTLCFRIAQVGHLVPLLPNVCTCTSGVRWETLDPDGNKLYFEVVKLDQDDNSVDSPRHMSTPIKFNTTENNVRNGNDNVRSISQSRNHSNGNKNNQNNHKVMDGQSKYSNSESNKTGHARPDSVKTLPIDGDEQHVSKSLNDISPIKMNNQRSNHQRTHNRLLRTPMHSSILELDEYQIENDVNRHTDTSFSLEDKQSKILDENVRQCNDNHRYVENKRIASTLTNTTHYENNKFTNQHDSTSVLKHKSIESFKEDLVEKTTYASNLIQEESVDGQRYEEYNIDQPYSRQGSFRVEHQIETQAQTLPRVSAKLGFFV